MISNCGKADKTKYVILIGVLICGVLLLCLMFALPRNTRSTNKISSDKAERSTTVFLPELKYIPETTEQPTNHGRISTEIYKLHSEKEGRSISMMQHMVSKTVLLPEMKNKQGTTERPTNHERVASEILAPDDTDISTISIRHVKQKLPKDKKKDENVPERMEGKKSHRAPKRHRTLHFARKSCPTQTRYVSKRTAEDIFGQTVDVYPVINIGNLALDQIFYESFCDVEKCSCVGVNSKRFESSCQTSHGYTYAKIVKSGEIGWSYIKVRSGCSCVIQEKKKVSTSIISDMLS